MYVDVFFIVGYLASRFLLVRFHEMIITAWDIIQRHLGVGPGTLLARGPRG